MSVSIHFAVERFEKDRWQVDEMSVLAGDDPASVRCVFGFSW